jgi:hypothetical protein
MQLLGIGPGGRRGGRRIRGRSRCGNRSGRWNIGNSGWPERIEHRRRRRKYGHAERPERFDGDRSAEQSRNGRHRERSRRQYPQRSQYLARHNAAWGAQFESHGNLELSFVFAQCANHVAQYADRESGHGRDAQWEHGSGNQRLDNWQWQHDRYSAAADVTTDSCTAKGARAGSFFIGMRIHDSWSDLLVRRGWRQSAKMRSCVLLQCR